MIKVKHFEQIDLNIALEDTSSVTEPAKLSVIYFRSYVFSIQKVIQTISQIIIR